MTRGGGEIALVAWGAQVERVRRFQTLLIMAPKVAGYSSHTGEHGKIVLWSCESVLKDLMIVTLCCLLSALRKYARYRSMPLVVLKDLDIRIVMDLLSYRQINIVNSDAIDCEVDIPIATNVLDTIGTIYPSVQLLAPYNASIPQQKNTFS